jgi:hypothetical protein
MVEEFKPAKFTLDFLHEEGIAIDGMTFGKTWNGWECPYFTPENSKKILSHFTEGFLKYNAEKDVYTYDCGYGEDELDIFEPSTIDGQKYYAIGWGSWCWFTPYDFEKGE